jgi:CsoR family transcriptional regulator, copper-sensing transcriptional repressor
MTVDRYIRIFAGSFILMLSLALGVEGSPLFVSPWFLAFTAFVGANLFQSGFTNVCPLGTILRKLGVPERRCRLHALSRPPCCSPAPGSGTWTMTRAPGREQSDPHPARPAPCPMLADDKTRTDLLNRLKRAEGQLRGIQRMIEEGQPCLDIAAQMAAVRKALDSTYVRMTVCFMQQELHSRLGEDQRRRSSTPCWATCSRCWARSAESPRPATRSSHHVRRPPPCRRGSGRRAFPAEAMSHRTTPRAR